jgi:hypothetical protein
MWIGTAISTTVLLILLLKVVALSARLEALQQTTCGTVGRGIHRIIKVLAIAGFLALCGSCFFLGLVAEAAPK